MAAWVVQELSDATLVDLAGRIKRDASTMSAAIRRFEVRRKKDHEFAKKVEQFRRELQVAVFHGKIKGTLWENKGDVGSKTT